MLSILKSRLALINKANTRTTPILFWVSECQRRFINTDGSGSGSLKFPLPPNLSQLSTPEDMALAKDWVGKFRNASIPRDHVELQFSRSSGPGGQNVNKVNTKATIKCNLGNRWIPAWAVPELRNSTYYVASSHSVQVSSTTTRSQSQNVDDALQKLHTAILTASSTPIINGPSESQKKKVENFQAQEKARRKVEKSHRSEVKRNRSNNSRDWGF